MARNSSGEEGKYFHVSGAPADVPAIIDVVPLEGNVNTSEVSFDNPTTCRNEYCESDEDYVARITDYITPNTFEWILIVLYFIVFLVGLIGNFLVIFSVARNAHMRTVTNYFIVNLSVADFMVILICLPPTVLDDVTQTWFMGRIPCKIIKYLQGVSVAVSVLTLTVISIERYYAICHPLRIKSTTRRVRVIIFLIWVISLCIMIPEVIYLDTHRRFPVQLTDLLTTCKPTWDYSSQTVFQIFIIVALYVLPFGLMGVCYIMIAASLWSNAIPTEQSNKPLNSSEGKSPAMAQLVARRKVAKMLIAVVVVFGVCYLPVHLLNILRYAKSLPEHENLIYFALTAHWLCYFNSSINPVIYNFMSEKFQKAFRFALSCETYQEYTSHSRKTYNTMTRTPERVYKSSDYV